MNLNRVFIGGNLTRDPELRWTPKGLAVATLTVANNRKAGEKEEVTFVDVTFFGKVAETVNEYFRKGQPILVDGRLRTESWDDQKTGQRRSKLSIIGDSFQFCGSVPDRPLASPDQGERLVGRTDSGTAQSPLLGVSVPPPRPERTAKSGTAGGQDPQDDIPF